MNKTIFILVGATGDLATRKLYPALFDSFVTSSLPTEFTLLGLGRKPLEHTEYHQLLIESLKNHPAQQVEDFLTHTQYRVADYANNTCVAQILQEFELSEGDTLVWYMAIPPQAFQQVIECVKTVKGAIPGIISRMVIEKPFGTDLASAQALNASLKDSFHEEEVYRIDHYLGKETVQNILALRFGNSIFEPVLNNRYVESIEISVLEELGVEGRAEYFDNAGIIKDILQNHILQIMALVMMDAPARMEAEFIRDEKYKILRSLKPIDCSEVTLGQYIANTEKGYSGYLEEPGVSPQSRTETYVSMTSYVDNLRWEGIPIQITTGKRMKEKKAEIRIIFKPSFKYFMHSDDECNPQKNELVIQIQPNEQVYAQVNAKLPGKGMCIQPVQLHFSYQEGFEVPTKDAYTRLLKDAIDGDQTLFIRSDEVEAAWHYVTPIIEQQACGEKQLIEYVAGEVI